MSKIFNNLLPSSSMFRMGSRPLSTGARPASRDRNNRACSPDYYEIVEDYQKLVDDHEEAGPSSATTEEHAPRGRNVVRRMVDLMESKIQTYRMNMRFRSARPMTTRHSCCVNANDEFQMKHTPMNRTFVIKQRSRSVDRLPGASERFPYGVADDSTRIADVTFDAGQASGSTPTPPKKIDQLSKKGKKNSPKSGGKSDPALKKRESPKIVGAFLKKPIDIEGTKVDWIPIKNDELPRQSSFKKFISGLTKTKSVSKIKKLFCSGQQTVPIVVERPMPGYEARPPSPCSLIHIENSEENRPDAEPIPSTSQERGTQVSSFLLPSTSKGTSRCGEKVAPTMMHLASKLMLKEVSRSDVRISLGPAFPGPSTANDNADLEPTLNESFRYHTNSEDTNVTVDIPPLPKHPFITPLRRQFPSGSSISRENAESLMSFEDFDRWDVKRIPVRKCASSLLISNTLKATLSSSDHNDFNNELTESYFRYYHENSYNPPPQLIRPKSCIFEDAISLKRRSTCRI